MTSRAERLGVTQGLVWMVGNSDEENALLDPLPDGVETITDRDESDHQDIAAALIVIDDIVTLAAVLDDALPQVGSIPRVWLAMPHRDRELSRDVVASAVSDYGWTATEDVPLGNNWLALRINPA